MMDRLTSMAVFVKTADTGSFAAAALAFDISAQMAGRHVAELEARIGGQLLNRTTRRQNLTEIGLAFYERCKQLLADVEEAQAVASNLSTTPRGRLRLTAPVTFGLFGLAPLVAPYLLDRPEVKIDLILTDRYVDLIGEGFDAAIRLGPLVDSSLVARALVPYQLVACAAPAYLGRHGTPSDPSELAGQECLSFAYSAAPPASEWHFVHGGRSSAVPIRSRFRTNDTRALITAARDGLGIMMAPEIAVRDDLARGALVRVLEAFAVPARPMHIVFPSGRVTLKLRQFVDQVLADYGG